MGVRMASTDLRAALQHLRSTVCERRETSPWGGPGQDVHDVFAAARHAAEQLSEAVDRERHARGCDVSSWKVVDDLEDVSQVVSAVLVDLSLESPVAHVDAISALCDVVLPQASIGH
mmetsp:Transcript_3188/g.4915  ORF Transcript_3188/g.4915 Transcript_3188/m.4915 type:complete len:117 (-) Transcript_3188:41-391(-)